MTYRQSDPVFRQLAASEVDLGYAVYLEAFRWLNDRGIRQWLVPQRRDLFDHRQKQDENFGLFVGGDMAVVLSLVQGTPTEWADIIAERRTWWLHNLATAQAYRGRSLGEVAVGMACEHLSKVGVHDLYLDCVDVAGFLPAFYARLGFTKIAERSTTYPTGNRFSMVLMRRESNDA